VNKSVHVHNCWQSRSGFFFEKKAVNQNRLHAKISVRSPAVNQLGTRRLSNMEPEEALIRWTARAALLLYVLALIVPRAVRGRRPGLNWSRCTWSAGCFVYLLHVACAFQLVHHWSHAEANAATARQTAEVVGLDWGGGLYANYAFTLLWLGDVCWWWLAPERYETRSRFIECSVQAFLGFMWFNATVVFGMGIARWLGLGACLLVGGAWACKRSANAKR